MYLIKTKISAAVLAVLFLSRLDAADSAFQFYFGGFDNVPVGAAGILVADQNGDGFLEPDDGQLIGLKLEAGQVLGPWNGDDWIVGVFAASDNGFGSGKTGFTGLVSRFKFDWRDAVPPGSALKFYWFPEQRPGDRLGKGTRYGTFTRSGSGTSGGTIGFFTPDAGQHEVISVLTNDSPGGGDFDGVTGVNTGLVGVGDFTGVEPPAHYLTPDNPASPLNSTDTSFTTDFRGTYPGLVSDASTDENLGEVLIKVSRTGGLSGRVTVNRIKYTVRGAFDENGTYAAEINSRHAPEPLNLVLQLVTTDSGGMKLIGTINGASGLSAIIDSHRQSFHSRNNPAPMTGRYTVLIPGPESFPGGDGFALVTVAKSGRITAKFRLGDYSPASDATYVSVDGEWPLSLIYNSRKLGSLAGSMRFRDEAESDIDGMLTWKKTAHTRQKFFPEGFTFQVPAIGSAFTKVEDGKLIDGIGYGWLNTAVTFQGGLSPNPGTAFTYWHDNNRFESRVRDGQKLSIKASRTTGYVYGRFTDRNESPTVTIRFYSAAFQKQNVISGVCNRLRTNQVGAVSIGPGFD